jgi:hypothetical protein
MLNWRIEATRDPKVPSPAPRVKISPARAQLWALVWAFMRGPGLAAVSDALKTAGTFLSKTWAWLETALRHLSEPKREPAPRRQIAANLRYSDLDLDEPEDALQALRRAARVPPHRRHLDIPSGE